MPEQTMCEYLLYLKSFSHVQQQQTEDPSVSKGFFVCDIEMTVMSMHDEKLHAETLIEMHA